MSDPQRRISTADRRRLRGRAWGSAAGLLFASVALVFGTPGAAQAADCPVRVHEPAIGAGDGTASASYDFAPQCSDGTARISGSVSDPLCDHRAAQLEYILQDRNADGSYRTINDRTFSVANGCGTSSTFVSTGPSPGSVGWRLFVKLNACNGSGCSKGGTLTYVG